MPRVSRLLPVVFVALLSAAPAGANPVTVVAVGPGSVAPLAGAPVDVARAYLASHPDAIAGVDVSTLRVVRVLPRPAGALVRFQQTHAGLDVLGGVVAVRIDDRGRVRWLSSWAAPIPADFDTMPTVSADEAIGQAQAAAARSLSPLPAANHARLGIEAAPGRAVRLVWEVVLPRDVVRQQTPRALVDARTGEVLRIENLVRRQGRANVFEFNPTTSTPSVATLDLPAGYANLSSPDIEARNCVDTHLCQSLGGFTLHWCEVLPTATPDGAGDFTAYTRPAADTQPEDPFSEVQMYYHVSQAYSYFRGLGLVNLNARPLTALVNVMIPDFGGGSFGCAAGSTIPSTDRLQPFDNAAFMPAGTLGGAFPPGDWIVFGQGAVVDYAYDGDVVFHEFTHAVMDTITTLGFALPDMYGLNPTPGGMQEGFPDYFSSAITGDSEVGEYAGTAVTSPISPPSGAIRSLVNTTHCPESLWGESHRDSEPWSAALWAIRTGVAAGDPAAAAAVDNAMYTVLDSLGPYDDFASAQGRVVAELNTAIGAAAGDLATTTFNSRGLVTCNNRVIPLAIGTPKDMVFLYGTDAVMGTTLVPGPMQFRIDLPVDAQEIRVDIARSQSLGGGFGGGSPGVRLVVKPGIDPILWNWPLVGGTPTHDATSTGNVTFGGGSTPSGSGTAAGTFPAGTYHVQLNNAGSSWAVAGVTFSYTPGLPMPDAGPEPSPEAGVDAGDRLPAPAVGCGCSMPGRSAGATAAGLGVLLGLGAAFVPLLRGRRRRSAI